MGLDSGLFLVAIQYDLKPMSDLLKEKWRTFKVAGVQFTEAGRELCGIVQIEPELDSHTDALREYFRRRGSLVGKVGMTV